MTVAFVSRNAIDPFGRDSAVPDTARGTTSTPASIASRNAPSRNSPTEPSGLRVPCGKRRTESLRSSRSRSSSIAFRALSLLPRSTSTSPATRICQPSSGMSKMDFFDSHFISQGSMATRNGSAFEAWFATKTYGRRGSGCTSSMTRKSQNRFSRAATTAMRWKRYPTR